MTTQEKPVCLGLDLGTKLGFAVGRAGKLLDHGTIDLADRAKRLRCEKTTALYAVLKELVKEHAVEVICRENSLMSFKNAQHNSKNDDPKYSAKHRMNEAISAHAAMGAIVDLVADVNHLTKIKPIMPISLKKLATGSGKAKKDQLMRQAQLEFGIRAGDDNEADACYVCVHAMQQANRSEMPF